MLAPGLLPAHRPVRCSIRERRARVRSAGPAGDQLGRDRRDAGSDAPRLGEAGVPGGRQKGLSAVDALMTASRVLVAVAARSLAGVADDVTVPQYRALVVIASRGPQRVADLAHHLGVAGPTATRMSDRLVRKGLVTRRTAEKDRRAVELSLSQEGRALVEEVTRRRRHEIATLLEAVPPQRHAAMVAALDDLIAAAGEVPDPDWVL